MPIRKCPRCDLNYILDDAKYCPVCMREVKGDQKPDDALETCSICNENPALPGKDMCLFCLKEMEDALKEGQGKALLDMDDPGDIEDAGDIEEIDIDTKDDIPAGEMGEIARELSLDDVLAEEEELSGQDDAQEDM